jgi:hypothetical protein
VTAVLALSALLIAVQGVHANPDILRQPHCAGFPLRYGTSIGLMGPSIGKQHARSIMALAAIARGRDLHARGWMVWDERGNPWLGITQSSPPDLRKLWVFKVPPTFTSRAGVQVRFAPMTKPLPANYNIVDCPDALPYGG